MQLTGDLGAYISSQESVSMQTKKCLSYTSPLTPSLLSGVSPPQQRALYLLLSFFVFTVLGFLITFSGLLFPIKSESLISTKLNLEGLLDSSWNFLVLYSSWLVRTVRGLYLKAENVHGPAVLCPWKPNGSDDTRLGPMQRPSHKRGIRQTILVGWESESCVSNRIDNDVENGIFLLIFWHCLCDWDFRTRHAEVKNWPQSLTLFGKSIDLFQMQRSCPKPRTFAFLVDFSILTFPRVYSTISSSTVIVLNLPPSNTVEVQDKLHTFFLPRKLLLSKNWKLAPRVREN